MPEADLATEEPHGIIFQLGIGLTTAMRAPMPNCAAAGGGAAAASAAQKTHGEQHALSESHETS